MISKTDKLYLDKRMEFKDIDNKEEYFIVLFPSINKWILVNKNVKIIMQNISNNTLEELSIKLKNDIYLSKISFEEIEEIVEQLYSNGILFTETIKDEETIWPLKSIYLEITTKCNLKCNHCFGSFGECKEISLDYGKIKHLIYEAKIMGVETIVLSGGEPSLHEEFINICKYIINSSLNLIIATNGMIVNDEILSVLENENVKIQISLEGISPKIHNGLRGPNAFEILQENINKLFQKKLNEKLIISTTVFDGNVDELPQLLQWCVDKKINKIAFKKMLSIGRGSQFCQKMNKCGYSFFEKELLIIANSFREKIEINGVPDIFSFTLDNILDENHVCTLGENIRITSEGDVYPCQLLIGDEFKIGNIYNESLLEIMNGLKLKNVVEIANTRYLKIEKCNNCSFVNFCYGGCMAQSLNEYGTIYKEYPFCNVRKNTYIKQLKMEFEDDGKV